MKTKKSKTKKKTMKLSSKIKSKAKSSPRKVATSQRDAQVIPMAAQKRSPQKASGIEERIQSGVAYVGNSFETIGKRISRAASFKMDSRSKR